MSEQMPQFNFSKKDDQEKPVSSFPGKVFDSENGLVEILKLSKHERPQALSAWREKYAEQRTSLASLQAELISFARKNPNVTEEQLLEVMEQKKEGHQFTDEQLEITKSAIDLCLEKREIIRVIREKYPDDRELFKAVFGIYPFGKINVETGLITLKFECTNRIDHARVYNFDENASAVFLTLIEGIMANRTRGCIVSKNLLVPELNGSVITEDLSAKSERGGGSAMIHEEQHAFRRLWNQIEINNIEEESNRDSSKIEIIEKEILRRCKENIESRIEDELLALLKSRSYDGIIFNKMEEYYVDAYIHHEKSILRKKLSNDYNNETSELDAENISEALTMRTIEILNSGKFHDELIKEIFSAVEAYGMLYHRMDMSHEEIAALLAFESLPQWAKLANRLVEQKEKVRSAGEN